jgi:gluconolactonase
MDRRAFLGAMAAGATALKATAATTERPLGETGVPLQGSEPLPLGPLPGGRYPDPHVESLKKAKGAPSDKPGSRASRVPWRSSA